MSIALHWASRVRMVDLLMRRVWSGCAVAIATWCLIVAMLLLLVRDLTMILPLM